MVSNTQEVFFLNPRPKVTKVAYRKQKKVSWGWCHRSAQRIQDLANSSKLASTALSQLRKLRVCLQNFSQKVLRLRRPSAQPVVWAQSDLIIRLVNEARLPLVHHVEGW